MVNAMRILVSGLNVFDSGKTWVSIAMYKAALACGFKPSIYKPVASFNLWFGYGTYMESMKRKLLLSNDVLFYENYLKVTDLSMINPISIALAPLDPDKYRVQRAIESYHRDSQDLFQQIVLSRVSTCNGKTVHYVFPENLGKLSTIMESRVRELSLALGSTPSKIEEFKAFLVSVSGEEVLTKCEEKLSEGSDLVIIESFSDSLAPYGKSLLESDYIVVVSPSVLYILKNNDSLLNIIENGLNTVGIEALRTYYVLQRVEPINKIEIDMAPSPESLAQQLDHALHGLGIKKSS
jgi:predicted P-loop ATPase/GTPase